VRFYHAYPRRPLPSAPPRERKETCVGSKEGCPRGCACRRRGPWKRPPLTRSCPVCELACINAFLPAHTGRDMQILPRPLGESQQLGECWKRRVLEASEHRHARGLVRAEDAGAGGGCWCGRRMLVQAKRAGKNDVLTAEAGQHAIVPGTRCHHPRVAAQRG
jgi:hypothetical protein